MSESANKQTEAVAAAARRMMELVRMSPRASIVEVLQEQSPVQSQQSARNSQSEQTNDV